MKQVREVHMWRQVRGPARAVMCETRDLGIKWPHWRVSERREDDASATGQDSLLEEVGSKA